MFSRLFIILFMFICVNHTHYVHMAVYYYFYDKLENINNILLTDPRASDHIFYFCVSSNVVVKLYAEVSCTYMRRSKDNDIALDRT